MTWYANEDISEFKKGDEVPAEIAEVWNEMYKVSPVSRIKPDSENKPKTDISLDLNGDGKVDKKDASIAGKVLAKTRRKRTSKKK